MNRRDFLKRIVAVGVAVAAAPLVDLLPAARAVVQTPRLNFDEINEITLKHYLPGIEDEFFTASPLLEYLKSSQQVTYRPGNPLLAPMVYR